MRKYLFHYLLVKSIAHLLGDFFARDLFAILFEADYASALSQPRNEIEGTWKKQTEKSRIVFLVYWRSALNCTHVHNCTVVRFHSSYFLLYFTF